MPARSIAARQRRRACLALALAWPAPLVLAAPFLPGSIADQPTGEVGAPTAEEPLRGTGIRWMLAPWRSAGSLALEARSLRLEDGRRSRTTLALGDIDMASYIWQPWFVQLRFGLGFVASRAQGDEQAAGSDNATLNGRAAIALFPASRFPFELRADVSDSRSGGVALGGDYRSRRISLSQGWRPEVGNTQLQLQLDRSELIDSRSRDTLVTFNGTGTHLAGPHQVDVVASHSENRRSDSDESVRLSALSGRHGWQPSGATRLETLASWNATRLRGQALDTGSEVRQIASFGTWRLPAPAGKPPGTAPVVAATLRWVDTRSIGSEVGSQLQAWNGTLGLSQELGTDWRLAASAYANQLRSSVNGSAESQGLQGAANWAPAPTAWRQWRYAPSVSASLTGNRDSERGERTLTGLQGSHGLSRDFPRGPGQLIAVALTQSAGVLHESGDEPPARALAHGLALSWQQIGTEGGQGYGGLTLSEARSEGRTRGRFQLVNLQLSQRTPLSRSASFSANLTLQATRNVASEVDVFTGERRELGLGWQRFHNASLAYETQRAFGVPRLRGTVLLAVNSQPLERRALGDIDAPRERITESLEGRLDHAVGRLETRLSARMARVDGRSVVALQARAQRRF